MVDDSPLQRWEEASISYRNRPYASMSKDDFMVAITAALTRLERDEGLAFPDILKARAHAHACADRSFLLSPIEQLYLSVAVLPMARAIDDRHDPELRFHIEMWDQAVSRLKERHYPAAAEILMMLISQLIATRKLEHADFLMNKTEEFVVTDSDGLRLNALHRELSRRRHPSSP